MITPSVARVLSWSDDGMLLYWCPETGEPLRILAAPRDWRAADTAFVAAFPFIHALQHSLELRPSTIDANGGVVVLRVGRRLQIARFVSQAEGFDEGQLPPIKPYSPDAETVAWFTRDRKIMTPREEKLLKAGLGITAAEQAAANADVQSFEVTRERIRQIEARALRTLRHPARAAQRRRSIDPDRSGSDDEEK